MKSFVSSLAIVASASAQVVCTVEEREASTIPCPLNETCFVDDTTGLPECGGADIQCTVADIDYDCYGTSYRCLAPDPTDDTYKVCSVCFAQEDCSETTSPTNSQCVAVGGLGSYCSDGTCPTEYTSDNCQADWWCYFDTTTVPGSTPDSGICTAACTDNASCVTGYGPNLACQTNDLGQNPSLVNKCVPSCTSGSCPGDFLCAGMPVELWNGTSFDTTEAGVCYASQCTLDNVDSCSSTQECNPDTQACEDATSCTVETIDSCTSNLCDVTRGNCVSCSSASDAAEVNTCTTNATCESGICTGISCDPTAATYPESACAATESVCVEDGTVSTCMLCDSVHGCGTDYTCVIGAEGVQNACKVNECDFSTNGADGCTATVAFEECNSENQCVARLCSSSACATGVCDGTDCAACSSTDAALACDTSNQTCGEDNGVCAETACDPTAAYADSPCLSSASVCVSSSTTVTTVGTCMLCNDSTAECATTYSCVTGTSGESATQNACMENQCDFSANGEDGCTATVAWQKCTEENQCVARECDSGCTGICVADLCAACTEAGAAGGCDAASYCSATADGSCTSDCSADNACTISWQECNGIGQCQGAACEAAFDTDGGNPTCVATVDPAQNSVCVSSMCESCEDAADDACGTGYYCLTSASTTAGVTGNEGGCYVAVCTADTAADVCTQNESCNLDNGLCESIACTQENAATNCPTMACDETTNVCVDCVANETAETSNCATGFYCYAESTVCAAVTCSAKTECLVNQTCSFRGLCVAQTCETSVDCCQAVSTTDTTCQGSSLCDATTNECVACTATAGTAATSCQTGNDETWFCATEGTMTGQCSRKSCSATVSCDSYTEQCVAEYCSLESGCVADPTLCVGTDAQAGNFAVCDSTNDVCAGCTTSTDADTGDLTSDCVTTTTANYYCNTENVGNQGNYCALSSCIATPCGSEQVCESEGTGNCEDVACTAETATTCATKVCGTASVCIQCTYDAADSDNNDDSEVTGCPASDSDADTYYQCGLDGICTMMADEGLSGGAIAGIIIGSVVGVALIAGAIFMLTKKDPATEGALLAAHTDE